MDDAQKNPHDPTQNQPIAQNIGSVVKESGPISAPEISKELKDIGVAEVPLPEAPVIEKFKVDLPEIKEEENLSQVAPTPSLKIISVDEARLILKSKADVKNGIAWEASEVVRQEDKKAA